MNNETVEDAVTDLINSHIQWPDADMMSVNAFVDASMPEIKSQLADYVHNIDDAREIVVGVWRRLRTTDVN